MAVPQTLEVRVTQEHTTLTTSLRLPSGLPDDLSEALPSGAKIEVVYELKVRSARRLWWDKRVWSGDAIATAIFDPVTGSYRCELVLDDVIVETLDTTQSQQALQWLTSPPAVQLALELTRRDPHLEIKARAVFSSSTVWLIFPSTDATEWVEVEPETEP